MLSTLRVAASGALSNQRALEVTSNNLANVNTTGFKARRAALVDLPPGETTFGLEQADRSLTPGPGDVGGGVVVGGVLTDYAPGSIQTTGRSLDVAIVGDGFLTVALPGGRTGYTRDGALQVDGSGRLTTGGGLPLSPEIVVPPGAKELAIESDGRVLATLNGARQEVGRLLLVRFPNPEGLESLGENLLAPTDNAGLAVVGQPGADGLGKLASGSLETSNVNMATELVRTIQAQRAYQVSLRAVRTVDEMLQEANNLRR